MKHVPNNKCYNTWKEYFAHQEHLWVFGYGSLMWRPDFQYAARYQGIAQGVSRRYCIISTTYRGYPEKPGRVLGLVEGGTCQGAVYRVDKHNIFDVFHQVWEREMISDAYNPRIISVRLGAETKTVEALGFLADPNHKQFDGSSSDAEIVRYIYQGHGKAGSNLDYFHETLQQLKAEGIEDEYINRLAQHLS